MASVINVGYEAVVLYFTVLRHSLLSVQTGRAEEQHCLWRGWGRRVVSRREEYGQDVSVGRGLPVQSAVSPVSFICSMKATVASSERSFSKLKLIKSNLRSTMSQARLSILAILSIENAVAKEIISIKIFPSFQINDKIIKMGSKICIKLKRYIVLF